MAKKDSEENLDKVSPRAAAFMREHSETKEIPGEAQEVAIGDDEDDDEEESESTSSETPRQAKRKNRFASVQRDLETTRRELDEQKRRAEMAELSSRQTQMYAAGVQQLLGSGPPQKTAEDSELERIGQQQTSLRDGFLGRRASLAQGQDLARDDYDKYNREQQALADRRAELIAKKTVGTPQKQLTQHDVRVEANRMMLLQRFPDVMGVPQYAQYAAHAYQAKTVAGVPEEQALVSAIDDARKQFNLKRSEDPKKARIERSRMSGPPSGNVAPATTRRVVQLTKAEQKMAETRYPKLAGQDPRKAWKRWSEVTGKGAEDDA